MKIIEGEEFNYPQFIEIEGCTIEKIEEAFETIRNYFKKARTPVISFDIQVSYYRNFEDEKKFQEKEGNPHKSELDQKNE